MLIPTDSGLFRIPARITSFQIYCFPFIVHHSSFIVTDSSFILHLSSFK